MKQSIYFRIQSSDKMDDVSCTTENRCRKSSSGEFRSDRDSTVKARTGSDAIQHWAHDAMTLAKTFEERDTLNQAVVRIVKGTARAWSIQYEIREIISPASITQAMGSDANVRRSCRVKVTSRAKSVWPDENNRIAIALSSNHQFKIPEHILNRRRRCHEKGIVRHSKDPIE